GDGLPTGAVAFQVTDERSVDDVLLEAVEEDRPDEPAVLADLVDHRVGGAGQHDVLVDAGDLVRRPDPTEEVLVDVGLPCTEARAGTGAGRAALVAVGAVARAAVLLELERLVD